MNILFISHRLYPCVVGGAEIFNYYLLKELPLFCDISLITSCSKHDDLNVSLIEIDPKKFGSARVALPLQDIFHILKLRKKIDLIHVSSYMRAFWLQWIPYPLMKMIFGIPYIVTIHGGGMHEWKPSFPHKFLFNNASAVIGISKRIKKEYEKRSGREVDFIPPLIPFDLCSEDRETVRRRHGYGSRETILLCLGSIKKIKGCDTLLNAFMSLGKGFIGEHKLKLIFAGDGDMREDMERLASERGFSDLVKFTGWVPHSEVPELFRIADIYVLPSHFEGTPISMLEAMCNEMPIIGSDVDGINDIIEDERNGLLFEVNDQEELTNKISLLVRDKNVAKKIAAQARMDYEKKYNYEEVVRQYKDLYEALTVRKNK